MAGDRVGNPAINPCVSPPLAVIAPDGCSISSLFSLLTIIRIRDFFCGSTISKATVGRFMICVLIVEYWCELKLPDSDFDRYGLYFYNDLLFAGENETGVTKVTNITSGSLVYVVPPVEDYLTFGGTSGNRSHKFEVVESSGVILGIFVSEYSNGKLLNLVHRLVINNSGISRWSKTENIGNYAIFMDLDSVCFMLEANDLAGIKANCIYALKQKYVRLYDVYLNEIERLDIETGAREHERCPFQNGVSWYVPRLHHLHT